MGIDRGAYSNISQVTTDATATVLWTYAVPDNCSQQVVAYVTARRPSNGDCLFVTVRGFASRVVGAAVLSTLGTITCSVAGSAGWSVTLTVSGNDVNVRVTGAAATTIHWALEGHVRELNEGIF